MSVCMNIYEYLTYLLVRGNSYFRYVMLYMFIYVYNFLNLITILVFLNNELSSYDANRYTEWYTKEFLFTMEIYCIIYNARKREEWIFELKYILNEDITSSLIRFSFIKKLQLIFFLATRKNNEYSVIFFVFFSDFFL